MAARSILQTLPTMLACAMRAMAFQMVQLSAVPNVYDDYESGQPAVTKNGKYLYVPYYL